MIDEERNFGKLSRPERKRLAAGAENALVAKTGAPIGNTPRGKIIPSAYISGA